MLTQALKNLRGKHAKPAYAQLEIMKLEIEKRFGALEWQELPDGKDCRIIQFRPGESTDERGWPELHEWLKEGAESFYNVFLDRIKKLDL